MTTEQGFILAVDTIEVLLAMVSLKDGSRQGLEENLEELRKLRDEWVAVTPALSLGAREAERPKLLAQEKAFETKTLDQVTSPTPKSPAEPPSEDGLYWVTTGWLTAGFVISGGKVTLCAPVLKRRLEHWMTIAVKVDG